MRRKVEREEEEEDHELEEQEQEQEDDQEQDNRHVASQSESRKEQELRERQFYELYRWNPGKFEDVSAYAKDASPSHELFDGLKFEFIRDWTEKHHITHTLSYGSAREPPSYLFAANNYWKHGLATSARYNSMGHVMFRGMLSFGRLHFTSSIQSSAQEGQSALTMDGEYRGSRSTTTLRWSSMGHYSFSFLQSMTQFFCLGVDLYHNIKQRTTLSSVGGRLELWGCWAFSFVASPEGVINFSTINSGGSLGVGSDWTIQKSQGKYEFLTAVSTIIRSSNSVFKISLDTEGKISAWLEDVVSQNTKIQFSVEGEPFKGSASLGLGFSFKL